MAYVSPADLMKAVWDADPTIVAIGAASARNGADLPAGVYWMISTVACTYKQGDNTITATTTSNYLPANVPVALHVTGASKARVAVIRTAVDGSLFIMRPSEG